MEDNNASSVVADGQLVTAASSEITEDIDAVRPDKRKDKRRSEACDSLCVFLVPADDDFSRARIIYASK